MKFPYAAVADVAAIAVFAGVGRASHGEAVSPVGLLATGWPFLVGWAAGTLVARGWRRPESLASGAAGWIAAVTGGMLLRAVTGQGVAPAFVVVATISLGVLLLGWRLAVLLVRRGRVPQPAR